MYYCEDGQIPAIGAYPKGDEYSGDEGNANAEKGDFPITMRNIKTNLTDDAIVIKIGRPTSMRRFFDNKQLSDIKLKVDERVFDAHKLVLVSASDVFETMLMKNDWREASQQEIELHEVDSDVFALVLEFLYTREIRLHIENIMSVYQIAEKYNLKGVKRCLCIFLHTFISERQQQGKLTAPEATAICNAFAADSLMHPGLKCIIQWICLNFSSFIESCEWETLPRSTVLMILQKDEIGGNEQIIFAAAKRWLEFDSSRTESPELIYEVLQNARLTFLSAIELYAIENDPIVVRCAPMMKLVSATIRRNFYKGVPNFIDIRMPENWLKPRGQFYLFPPRTPTAAGFVRILPRIDRHYDGYITF